MKGILAVLRRARSTNIGYQGGEAELFSGLLQIVERTLDVLELLHMLAQSLLSMNGKYDISALAGLPFRHLVMGDHGRETVRNIVKTTKILNCAKLAQKCPHLLTIPEAEIQHAHELLEGPNWLYEQTHSI